MNANNGAEGGTHWVDEEKVVDKVFLHFYDKLILQLVIVYWFMNKRNPILAPKIAVLFSFLLIKW